MSPFDQNIDYDAGHTIDPAIDQDDLIAFHLHELTPSQERALHRVLHTSPTLQTESVAIATTLRAFPKHEAALPLNTAALDRHWQALRPSLTPHIPPPIAPRTLFPRSIFHHWALPTLAASALVATTLLVAWHYTRPNQPPAIATNTTATLSPTTPNHPEASQLNLPTNSQSNLFNPLPLTPHRAWLSSSAPLETAANTPAPIFPVQAPTPLTPTSPSNPAAGTPSTAATLPLPSNPAQTQPPTPSAIQSGRSLRTSARHNSPATELTLGMFGNITASRSSSYTSVFGTSQITQTATPAVGALASFRQQLRPWLGYRLTTTYFSPSFNYFNGPDIRDRIYEVSATYVAQGPHHRRLTTSVEAGASLLNFRYTNDYTYPAPATNTSTYRAAGVVGIGAEYALSKHWGLRAEYRALVYRPPPVADPDYTVIAPTADLTFSSNPILGITYRFGATGRD